MWQTKYASAAPKNLGVGVNFWPCSEGYFLSGRPQSVSKTILLLGLKLQCLYDLDLNQDHNGVKLLLKYHTYDVLKRIHKTFFQFFLLFVVGQIISECLFDVFKFSKKPTKSLTNFCPESKKWSNNHIGFLIH